MNNTKVKIPKPCNVDWNGMTPSGNGRYCNLCDKTVVDFTAMSLEEIKLYFEERRGEKTCGYFKASQAETERRTLDKWLIGAHAYFEPKLSVPFFRLTLLWFITLCMAMVGCRNSTVGEKDATNDPDTSYINDIKGLPVEILPPPDTENSKRDTIKLKQEKKK